MSKAEMYDAYDFFLELNAALVWDKVIMIQACCMYLY